MRAGSGKIVRFGPGGGTVRGRAGRERVHVRVGGRDLGVALVREGTKAAVPVLRLRAGDHGARQRPVRGDACGPV